MRASAGRCGEEEPGLSEYLHNLQGGVLRGIVRGTHRSCEVCGKCMLSNGGVEFDVLFRRPHYIGARYLPIAF